MGRSLKPARVHQTVTSIIATKLSAPAKQDRIVSNYTPWLETLSRIPPAEILTRSQPPQVRHTQRHMHKKIRKPSRLFTPQQITYPDDEIRQQFFQDHPWELARPRIVLEQDGKEGQRCDWSKIEQPGRQLTGESVVQRQLWLLENEKVLDPVTGVEEPMTLQQAYDKARKEFYAIRHAREVEVRVAREEALSTGAYFGKTRLELGLEQENKMYEAWKAWATTEVNAIEQQKSAAYTGSEADEAVTAQGALPELD